MNPRIIPVQAVLFALLAAGCGGAQQPTPAAPAATPPAQQTAPPALAPPPQTEIRDELLGSLVVGSLDSLLAAASSYVAPAMPAAFQAVIQPDALRAQLFKQLQLESFAPALEGGRPWALAVADPLGYRQGPLGAIVVAVPVKDEAAFLDALGRMATRQESTPWKDRAFTMAGGVVLCRLDKGYALLASHQKLLHGARGALLPLLEKSAPGKLQLALHMTTVQARFGAQIDRAVDGGAALLGVGPQAMLRRWAGYLKGIGDLELRLALKPDRMHARLVAQALGQGEFRKYLDALPAGAPWGAKYLPADSAVIVLNRTRPEEWPRLIDELLGLGRGKLDAKAESSLQQIRQAAAGIDQLGAESAWALWVNGDGGLGIGGAMAVKDGATAQKQLARAMKLSASSALWRELPADKPRLSLAVRAVPVGGLKADLYELTIGWPRPKGKEDRRKLEEQKKVVAKLVGARPSFAFVTTGEVGLVAFGKDWKKRLVELVAIARGGAPSKQEKVCQELAAGRSVSLLLHSPLVRLVEAGLRVADQLTAVPQSLRDAVNRVLPGSGKTIPATAILHKDRDTLLWDLEVSPDLVASLSKVVLFFRGAAVP